MIDLHTHSNKSDGSFSPEELVLYAKQKGLVGLALTDHDSVAGLKAAKIAAEKADIDFVSGVELSAAYQGEDIHILGLFIDENCRELNIALEDFQQKREYRNVQIIQKLKEQGLAIDEQELLAKGRDISLTRLHLALYLKQHGHVETLNEAFDLYLGDGKPCYVKKEMISAEEGIRIIQKSGGIAILAHPFRYRMGLAEVKTMIETLTKVGLQGLECYYSLHSKKEQKWLVALADKYQLLKSGGSDFHGIHKMGIDLGCGKGNLKVPEECLAILSKAAENGKISADVIIEEVKSTDLDAVVALEATCFPAAEAATKEELWRRIELFRESFFVAKYQGQIIGFINGCVTDEEHLCDEMYHESSYHNSDGKYQMIFGLDVSPHFRRRGIARKLMEHMINNAVKRNKVGLVLTCKAGLVPYYESFGYENRGKSDSAHGGADWYEMVFNIKK